MILDVTRGEYVCTSCATVIDVLYLPSKSMYEYEPLHLRPEMDLSEATDSEGNPSREVPLLRKLRVINSKLRRTSDLSVPKCLYQAGSKLGLEETHLRFAARVYRFLLAKLRDNQDSVNVTSCKVAAAAVLYTILRFNIPVSIREVVRIFRELGHRVSATDIIELLRLAFGKFSYDVRERVLAYVSYLAAKCGVDESSRIKLVKLASRILTRVRGTGLTGKNPRTLAAAIFAYCVSELGLNISLIDIASQLDISPLTLKEHVRRLQKILVSQAECCGAI